MALAIGQIQKFSYTGKIQSIDLKAGKYKIQCYGAQGGGPGSAGQSCEGIIDLKKSCVVNILCGGTPSDSSGGYGSGQPGQSGGGKSAYGGGGGSSVTVASDNTTLISAAGGKGLNDSYNEIQESVTTYASGTFSCTVYGSRYLVQVSFTATASGRASVSCYWANGAISSSSSSVNGIYVVAGGTTVASNKSNKSASCTLSWTATKGQTYTVYAIGGLTGRTSVSYGVPQTVTNTVTHTLAGGNGGLTTSAPNFTDVEIGTNTGNGYVIITCQSIHSLIINCKHCTIEGYLSLELIEAGTYRLEALHSMFIDGIPSILDNISVPEGLIMYINIVSLRLVELIVDNGLLAKGEEYTIEALYHENIRLNSDFYKNTKNGLSDFLAIIGG